MLHQHKGLQALSAGKSVKHGHRPPCLTFSSRKQQQDVSRALVVSCRASSGSEGSSSSSSNSSSGMPSVTVADPQIATTGPDAAAAAAAAGGGSSGGASGAADKNAALAARIAAAKAYKSGSSSASSSSSGSAGTPSSDSSGDSLEQKSAVLCDAEQEAMRQQYLQQLQQQQQELATQSSAYNSFLQQSSSSSSSDPLERLAAEDQGWGPGSKTGPARSDFYTSADAPEVQQLLSSAPKRQGTGSADEAADWLKGVLQDTGKPQIDSNMRMEDITLAKEAALKQRGAEIITAFPEDFASSSSSSTGGTSEGSSSDAAAAAANEVDEDGRYKPKVTTWGVFPRPQNISAAYGGGRNIRPGQDLETPQQKAQREAEYAAALAKYKAATFTDSISEEELAAAQARFNEGMKLFNRGVIDKALVIFDEVRAKVPLKSKLGGMSTLQAAVCYDTLGNGRQAEALYKRIQGHPTTEVGRKARQLVFGFQAMTFLKTEGLNYAVKKEDYLKYFRRSADRTRVYVASEEERIADAAEARKAAALAAGIVLGPVIMMGAMVLGK